MSVDILYVQTSNGVLWRVREKDVASKIEVSAVDSGRRIGVEGGTLVQSLHSPYPYYCNILYIHITIPIYIPLFLSLSIILFRYYYASRYSLWH